MNRLDPAIAAGHDERVSQDFQPPALGRMQRRTEKRAIGRNLRDCHEWDDGRARNGVSMNLKAMNWRPNSARPARADAPIYCKNDRSALCVLTR
jgi:hypothetical protein